MVWEYPSHKNLSEQKLSSDLISSVWQVEIVVFFSNTKQIVHLSEIDCLLLKLQNISDYTLYQSLMLY